MGTINRRMGGQQHRLYEVDGQELPSVTSVLKMIAKPALTTWLQKQVATAAVETQDWRAQDPETAIEMIMAASRSTGRKAAMKGTDIHQAIDEGRALADVPEDHRPYLKAAEAAMAEIGLVFSHKEVTLANLHQGYAGTADGLLFHEDLQSLAIMDWKTTSSTAGWREHQLQLAAYAACDTIVTSDGELHPVPQPVTELIVVGLKADATADIRRLTDSHRIHDLQDAFYGLLEVWKLDRDWPYLTIWDEATEGVTL
jgi:hypothetical protein